MRGAALLSLFALGAASLPGCDGSEPIGPLAVPDASVPLEAAAEKVLDPALCALDRPGYTLRSTNDWFPLGVRSHWFLEGEEDDELLQVRITVLNRTENVGGVKTRVVEEREWVDGELLEVSRNFFAVAADGTVCYFGEEVDIYEDGHVVSHDGAWRADQPGNRPGIFLPADPRRGMRYQMEGAPGVAEDEAVVVRSRTVEVPAGTFTRTVAIRESNPLEGGGVGDLKVFAAKIGLIVDGPIGLVDYRIAQN